MAKGDANKFFQKHYNVAMEFLKEKEGACLLDIFPAIFIPDTIIVRWTKDGTETESKLRVGRQRRAKKKFDRE